MKNGTERLAVITGGGTGLGLGCAKRFLAAGYRVIALGRDAEDLPNDPMFDYRPFDVTDPHAVETFASGVPSLDALVNAAGIILYEGREHEENGFDRVMDVNVGGTRRMAYALRGALAERGGAVVNFCSMWSLFGSGRNPAYSTSKGAVLQLTKSLAVAWAQDGVRVNAVAPGWVKSRMSHQAMTDPVRSAPTLARIPMQRWGEPGEVGDVVLFLCSPQASYVTGAMLPVDGGFSIS